MDSTTFISEIELPNDSQTIDAHSLYAAFEQVTDGRKKRGKRYSLPLLLTLLLLALLDWLGVPNVPEQMRLYAARPHLALALLLSKL